MSVLIKVNDKLWINPNALLSVQRLEHFNGHGYSDGICLCLNGTVEHITLEEWAAIEPLVTLPARAAKYEPRSSASSVMQAVDEILAEEGCTGTVGISDVGLEGVEYYFPSFDIIEDDLPSQIDRFEAEHPESIPGDAWLAPTPDTEEDEAERAALEAEKLKRANAWLEPATEEELSNQGGNSGDYLDDYDDEDDDEEWHPYY